MSLCNCSNGSPALSSLLLLASGIALGGGVPADAFAQSAEAQPPPTAPVLESGEWTDAESSEAPGPSMGVHDMGQNDEQGPAQAAGPTLGFETGFRTGLGLGVGSAGVDANGATRDLSGMAALRVPLWIDALYRTSPDWAGGAYGQYGMGTAGSACPGSCNWAELRVGIQGQWQLAAQSNRSPWLGVGLGYQWLTFRTIRSFDLGLSDGPDDQLPLQRTESLHGPELLIQGGLDFAVHPGFSLGPYASATFSQFLGASRACENPEAADLLPTQVACPESSVDGAGLHAWLGVGLRGTFTP